MAADGANEGWGAAWPPLTERLADVLAASPVIVALLWEEPARSGETPMQQLRRVVREWPDLAIGSFDQLCLQILQTGAFSGPLDRPALLHEAADSDPEELDRRVRRLATVSLVTVTGGILTVDPDLAEALPLPLPAFGRDLDLYTSERLQQACRLLGVAGGTKKATRAAAIRAVIADPDALVEAVRSAHQRGPEVFARIAERSIAAAEPDDGRPPGTVSIWDLDLEPELVAVRSPYRFSHGHASQATDSAFDALAGRCLVGSISYGHTAWLWLESAVALSGRLFPTWNEPPLANAQPIDEPAGVAARVVVAAEMLIDQLAADAPEGKKTGDRRPPVKAGRNAAKAVGGIEPALADIVLTAAVGLGLLVAVDLAARGRGRAREWPVQWVANRARLDAWKALPVAQRWLSLVRSWLLAREVGYRSLSDATIRRFCAIGDLATLEPGTGIATSELSGWLGGRHVAWPAISDDLIRDLTLLGITSSGTTIGLGAVGRAMLGAHIAAAEAGPELDELFAGDDASFVVQPDHTIITGSRASPEVVRMLTQIADRESEGGAVVWRLSGRALARAARTLDADMVITFLETHSSSDVSDNVIRYVRDHLREGATATIAAATSYLVCDDPVVVSAAVGVKAAKLTALAPTAAVSSLDPAALRAALTAKGISAELAGIGPDPGSAPAEPLASYHVDQPFADAPMQPAGPIPLGPQVIDSLVDHLSANRSGRRGK